MLILCNKYNRFHALEGQFTIELMIIRLVLAAAALANDAHFVDGVLCWLLRKIVAENCNKNLDKKELRKRIGFGRSC